MSYPEYEIKTTLTFRLSADMKDELTEAAKDENLTVSSFVEQLVAERLNFMREQEQRIQKLEHDAKKQKQLLAEKDLALEQAYTPSPNVQKDIEYLQDKYPDYSLHQIFDFALVCTSVNEKEWLAFIHIKNLLKTHPHLFTH